MGVLLCGLGVMETMFIIVDCSQFLVDPSPGLKSRV